VTSKADVIDWLKRSLEAVKAARAQLKPGDLERKVKIGNKVVTVDGMLPAHHHSQQRTHGQLVAYARMNGIVPPWSQPVQTENMGRNRFNQGALDAAKEMDSVGGGGCPSDRSAHCANQGGIPVHIQNSGLGDSPLARWQVMAAATPWVIFSLYWEIRGQKRGRAKSLETSLSRGVHLTLTNLALLLEIVQSGSWDDSFRSPF